ncbi:TPA: ABC transporter ATP-binding protein [Candidatus Woesearchaeota archaeon]|nr:ABC transporter ATP-binding protein [Candidatus Woesearchaeota archaeon]
MMTTGPSVPWRSSTEVVPSVWHLNFKSQYLLAATFVRFQEYYESPRFRGDVFSLEDFMDWYADTNGKFSYFEDWSGFNIPSYAFEPFKNGAFDPLSRKERSLLQFFDATPQPFYVIGSFGEGDARIIEHETAHGLFYTSPGYKKRVMGVLKTIDPAPIHKMLGDGLGYHPAVFDDETHAYLLDLPYLKKQSIDVEPLKGASARLKRLVKKFSKG